MKNKRFNQNENNKLIGIIEDEEIIAGYLLSRIERSENLINF